MVRAGGFCSEEGWSVDGIGEGYWEAKAGMLWHARYTSWFDFHAHSRLVHLRFPICFMAMAQDGVPVWFKWPGPTTREAQLIILSTGIRVKAKEKIAKVLRRRLS